MRLACFRLRTLMVAVAAVAVVLHGLHLYHLRRHYQAIAADYARRERVPHAWAVPRQDAREGNSFGEIRSDREYHARQRRKYERAARYPWFPVEPDPPEPK